MLTATMYVAQHIYIYNIICVSAQTKANLDVDYLVKCKIYNIFSKFLKFKLYRKSLLSSQLYKSWQTKLLNSEINEKKQTTSKLNKEIEHTEADLKSNLTFLIMFFAYDIPIILYLPLNNASLILIEKTIKFGFT